MLRVILKAFLTLILAVGFLSVSHAQQSTASLTGEWVGNSEPSGRSEFLRLSLTENAGELRKPLKAKLTLVHLEGPRVRLELSSLKLVIPNRFGRVRLKTGNGIGLVTTNQS